MAKLTPPVLIIDDFLEDSQAGDLLNHALIHEDRFRSSTVSTKNSVNDDWRKSREFIEGSDPVTEVLRRALLQNANDLFTGTGVPPFPVSNIELQVIAHGDGDFYRPHIDTRTDQEYTSDVSDRLVSAVYYFNAVPRPFTGGELGIYAFGGAEPAKRIEPVHNRLVAFPSFALHEVLPIACPSGKFSDSRFSVNCWIRRSRDQ